jgi:hypothetical protein
VKIVVVMVAGAGLLMGCSSGSGEPTAAQEPSSGTSAGSQGTVPVPTNTLSTAKPTDAAVPPDLPEQATAPPPAVAGPLTAANLPAPEKLGRGWKTYVDPGGAEKGFLGNQSWTRRRDGHQAAYEALPVGCANPLPDTSLPVPEHALQGAYRTGGNGSAKALLLRFSEAGKAASYYQGYQARMKACGAGTEGLAVQSLWSEASAAASVRRYAEAESYVEVAVLQDSTVELLAAESADPSSEVAWTHDVVPELKAGMSKS